MITNSQSGTNVHEIADGIYRINTPVALPGGVRRSASINTWCSTMRRCCFTPGSGSCFRWSARP